jgi:hypothetical protein
MSLRFGDWKDTRMVFKTAYVDASGRTSEVSVSPACVVASPEAWVEFDRRWESCLKSFHVTAFHASDFRRSDREFKGWDGDRPKRRRFMNHLLWIIEDLAEFTSACGVLIDDYRYVDKYYCLQETLKPYSLGSLTCVSAVVHWAIENNIDNEQFFWVFEKGDEDQDDLKKSWLIATRSGLTDPQFLRKVDEYPKGTVRRRIRPFEAADLIAYENLLIHRLFDEKQGETAYEDELSDVMQRMKKWKDAQTWKWCSVENLTDMCERWKVPLRKEESSGTHV